MRTALPKHPALAFAALALAALAAAPAYAHTTLIEEGRAAIVRGDAEKAIEILEKAVAESPKSPEAHYYLASAYGAKVQSSGMLGKAKYGPKMKAELESAVALDPKNVD